jgi:DNA-binding NarL/FixJ family response regulator
VEALSRRAELMVAGAAATFEEAAQCARDLQPDVMLIDSAMAACRRTIHAVVTTLPAIKVIVIGMSADAQSLIEHAEAGVAGFVPRDGSIGDVVLAVERAARGELACSPRQAAALLGRVTELARGGSSVAERSRLTERESEVLRYIDHGLSNKRIAATLGIELATVKNHVHNILEKLQCRTRAEAASQARAAVAVLPGSDHPLRPLSR